MQGDTILGSRLSPLRRRARVLLAERMAFTAGTCALAICLVLVALDRLRVLRVDGEVLVGIMGAALLAGCAWGALRRLSDFDIARAAESRLHLKERLSSAVALGTAADEDQMVRALVSDAAEKLRSVRPSALFPHHLGRRGQAFLGLLVVVAAALILPELPVFQSGATRRERAEMRQQGEKLVKLSTDLEKPALPKDKQKILRQLAANMKALGKDMQTARVTRKQALVKMNKLEQQAQVAKAELVSRDAKKSLAKAAAELKEGKDVSGEQAKLMSQLKAIQASQAAGQGSPLSEQQMRELEKLAKSLKPSQAQQLLKLDADLASKLAELLAKQDYQAALEILSRLAQKLQDPETLKQLSPEQLKQLADELKKLAEALKGTDLDELAKQMLEMAKALERGDLKQCEGGAKNLEKLCLGLSAGLSACNSALAGLEQCRGQGVGPGNGLAQYEPNSPSSVNRGASTRIPTKHYDTRIEGQQGEKGEAYSIQVLGDPDKPGKSQVPYYQVYSDYAKAAENAIDREEVPAPYRDRVKTYFESLKPAK